MGRLWGTPPFITKWLYTGIVRPVLMYGSLVWAKVTEMAWAKKELAKINDLLS